MQKQLLNQKGRTMKKYILPVVLCALLASTAFASQHDYDIANAPGATVRADINNVLDAIATNNSAGTAPSSTFANQWWMDTSTNLLKQRDNANTAWITIASKSGTTWIPYRAGTAIGTGATLTTDTDGTMAANSDSNVATQKAVKTFGDAIAADSFRKATASEFDALSEKTALVDDDRFLIEDSEDSDNKKYVIKSNIASVPFELFLTDGTFTAPTGVETVFLTGCGEGGGGAGSSGSPGAGGGSYGQCFVNHPFDVTPASSYTIQIGKDAGTGGTTGSPPGIDGEDTIFDTGGDPITAEGGNGGILTTGAASVPAKPSAADYDGGDAPSSNGGEPVTAQQPDPDFYHLYGDGGSAAGQFGSGAGGSGPWGTGGTGGDRNSSNVGTCSGLSSGGGGGSSGVGNQAGSDGCDGFLLVTW